MPEAPLMPEEIKPEEGPDGPIMRIPQEIRPAMQKHRIEVNFFLCFCIINDNF